MISIDTHLLGLVFGWMKQTRRDISFFILREFFLQVSIVSPVVLLIVLTGYGEVIDAPTLFWILGVFCCFHLIFLVLRTMSHRYSILSTRHKLDTIVRDDLVMRHILSSDPQILESTGTGRLFSLYVRDVRDIMVLSLGVIVQLIILAIAVAFSFYYLFSLGMIWIFLVVISLMCIAYFLAREVYCRNVPNTQQMYRIVKEFDQINSRYLSQPLLPIMTGTQERIIHQNKQLHADHLRSFFPTSLRLTAADSLLGGISIALFIFGALWMYISGAPYAQILSVLIFFAFFHVRLLQFFGWIIDQFPLIVNIQSAREMLARLQRFEGYTDGVSLASIDSITLADVSYCYDTKEAIAHMSYRFESAKSYALVGPSGGGKSTLVKILSGLLTPQGGDIKINDTLALRSIAKKGYFTHIGYLPQSPIVYDGTVYENLSFGLREDFSIQSLLVSLRKAHCDFLDGGHYHPECLDTLIGERGVNLSGGQKQRLALARIFLQKYDCIILDEPTAALDLESERYISESIVELQKHAIVITIAHRLSTIEHADEILFIRDGQLVESGSHHDLIARDGAYAQLIKTQSTI